MDECANLKVDVAVVGGGLQGLYVLKELLQRNYSAVLLAKGKLGGGQTSHAHAFVHEGHMFRRADNIRHTQSSYRDWAEYLSTPEAVSWEGHFYLADIDRADFSARLAVWGENISGLTTTAECEAPSHFNPGLAFWGGRGGCLNTSWLVERMACDYEQYIGSVSQDPTIDSSRDRVVIVAHNPRGEPIRVEARTVIAAAGVGNHDILAGCAVSDHRQQTVKAHMLVVRSGELQPIAGYFRPLLQHKAMFIAPRVVGETIVWLISDGNHKMVDVATPDKYAWPPHETSTWVRQVIESLAQLCAGHFGPEHRHRLQWAVYCAAKAEMETPKRWMPEGPEYRYIAEKSTCVVWPTLLTHIPRASREISLKEEWFGSPTGPLPPTRSAKWLEWKCRPEVADELWRTLPFQTWEDFRSCHGLA